MKKISIFGYGVTTKPIVKFLAKQDQKCVIFDDKFSEQSYDEFGNLLLPSACFRPENSELEILSPGIPPYHPLILKAKNPISEYDYFYSLFDKDYSPLTVWISGTNGKTTTTEMLTLLLQNHRARSGGNIGTPLGELFMNKDSLWVLESSSFSIHYTQKAYPKLYLLLPVREDHISWHGSFEAYMRDKLKPLKLMDSEGYAIIPKELSQAQEVKDYKGTIIFYEDSQSLAKELGIQIKDIEFSEPFLLDGLLALCASKVLFGIADVKTLNTFKIGKHRIEEFLDMNSRLWVDDSKGTNVDATLEAIKRYKNKKIFLILGGDDKGADQRPIFELIKSFDIEVFGIGSNEEKLFDLSKEYGVKMHMCGHLKNAIDNIKQALKIDNVALLSPAAASLDQFSSYKQRGELFKQYVLEDNLQDNKEL
ncbi:UDP-N-acetylmuramoyl-L-alanine--D-glutamate ligase [Helicobacter cappadocius]|uniref:UDP-N-acetylmuramoylalanine--D-glutamate ligase n=1 Tax=Helicobacter cappadocius TaxID=3063998 RepID=A0AA90PRP6_9HELI|nr:MULTISPECIES: UDP-N-acetylmuramoyl-L-alanine--D-glutamate ligase [unclassified Helicobacter]MDO7252377.1 UDP-N-acetylmuramoyl-L-alanine--D-glutamate ligase [Helicobacter sp. faydin-H75]MDP2538244.1 UDP-N-acetylmuramoyl-L-alanine--D-glutamate ligase [Helicobacter sp. faydin-H76]